MVKGLDKFKDYFKDFLDQYVIIGGTACEILFESNEVAFRSTRDLDVVLIVEALTEDFGKQLWKFIADGEYRNIFSSKQETQFYRFDKPKNDEFPKMIELFSQSNITLKKQASITPIHIRNEISSLSAILLDHDYYKLLIEGRVICNGLCVLRPEYLVLFKAKAYLDLKKRIINGERIDANNLKKHKKDILKISSNLILKKIEEIPNSIYEDISHFIEELINDPFEENYISSFGLTNDVLVHHLKDIFSIE